MPIATIQHIETALEKIRCMKLPEDEHVFRLNLDERNGVWYVMGTVNTIAGTIPEGHPYPVLRMIHSHDLEFPSKEEALSYAQKVHDILVERGKSSDAQTARLLGLIQ